MEVALDDDDVYNNADDVYDNDDVYNNVDDDEERRLMTWQLDAADEGGSGSPRRQPQSLNCLLYWE